jgi:hypothetical protein
MDYNPSMNANTETSVVDERVIEVLRQVLEDRMGRFGFEDARAHYGEDHDGDPVLYIDVDYRLSDEPIDAKATIGLVQALRYGTRSEPSVKRDSRTFAIISTRNRR